MFDGKAFGEEIVSIVKSYIAKSLAGIVQRLEAIEARPMPERGEPGRQGDAGEPGPAGSPGPQGPAGERGSDGKDGAGIAAIVRDGSRLNFELTDGRFFDAGELLRGEKGEPGPQGLPGRDGRDGAPGPAGPSGRDGRDGIDGKDGAPGRNGLSFEDILPPVYDSEGRTITLRFARGDRVLDLPLVLVGTTHYRGVWRDKEYVPGDLVTWDGSLWHCNAVTEDRPGIGSPKAWTLAVKRGRDGKNGEKGDRGPPGPAGKDGRDLTQMAFDGSKY